METEKPNNRVSVTKTIKMETLNLEKFNDKRINDNKISSIQAGDPCGTTWNSSKGPSGRDHYFDVNDNGILDAGDEVYLDDGRLLIR